MRVGAEARAIIKQTVAEIFGPDVIVRVFGSRLDDKARGGDIDLLVTSTQPVVESVKKVIHLKARLQMRLGDQPIDVLLIDPTTCKTGVHAHALQTGELV